MPLTHKVTFQVTLERCNNVQVPKLTLEVLKLREEKNLAGVILEVTITPVGKANEALPPESAETKMLDKIKNIRKNLNNTTP